MERDLINSTPAYALRADLIPGAAVTVSRTEVWSSLALLAGIAFAAVAGSTMIVWLSMAAA